MRWQPARVALTASSGGARVRQPAPPARGRSPPMRLYDTLRRSVEPFTAADNHVRLYVCGVTPYDTTHMGHAATMLAFDVLVRYLEHRGVRVTYIQNVTDVDDDIIRRARELGVSWDELGREQTERFLQDMRALNWREPDRYVRATDEIAMMIEINQKLIERGYAYESAGDVYQAV